MTAKAVGLLNGQSATDAGRRPRRGPQSFHARGGRISAAPSRHEMSNRRRPVIACEEGLFLEPAAESLYERSVRTKVHGGRAGRRVVESDRPVPLPQWPGRAPIRWPVSTPSGPGPPSALRRPKYSALSWSIVPDIAPSIPWLPNRISPAWWPRR